MNSRVTTACLNPRDMARPSAARPAEGPQALLEQCGGDVAGVVDLPVLREAAIDRVVLQPAGRRVVALHAMIGKREDGLAEARGQVAVLGPAVGDDDEVALPAFRRPGR